MLCTVLIIKELKIKFLMEKAMRVTLYKSLMELIKKECHR